jgi:hypothetical protein
LLLRVIQIISLIYHTQVCFKPGNSKATSDKDEM